MQRTQKTYINACISHEEASLDISCNKIGVVLGVKKHGEHGCADETFSLQYLLAKPE